MTFSGKMCFKIILKVTKYQGFTLSLEDTFFEKPQERGRGDQIDPCSRFRVNKHIIVNDEISTLCQLIARAN